jgi:hypothetical protein
MFDRLNDTLEVKRALAKAEECAKLAALAKTAKDRDYYDRMRRKWLGIADGWRVIDEIDEVPGRDPRSRGREPGETRSARPKRRPS